MAIPASFRSTSAKGGSSRRTTGIVIVATLAFLALMNVDGSTHRSLAEAGVRKLCHTVFGYKSWGEFWESLYYKETDYSATLGPRAAGVNDGNAVGYFLTLTNCPDDGYATGIDNHDPGHAFYDAAAMLKYSIVSNTYPKGSKYNATMYAIVHPDAVRCPDPKGTTYDRVAVLKELGYHVQILGNPVVPKELPPSIIEGLPKDAGDRSMMPLHLLDFPGHPIGVGVDFTTLVLQPMDEIFDKFIFSKQKVAFTMDYPDVLPATGSNAGVNTHFLLFKPTAATKEEFLKLYLTTPFSEQWGYNNQGVNGFAGKFGLKGFLAHYIGRINRNAGVVLERCKFGNDNHAAVGLDANGQKQCYDNLDCSDCRDMPLSDVKVIKMIETCGAPWSCSFNEKWDAKTKSTCEGFHREWFERRVEFEKECWHGAPPIRRNGDFKPEVFLGYCSCAGGDCYEQMVHDNPPTPAPTPAPTAPPTFWHDAVDPPRVLEECKGPVASWSGDPHFTTFDRLKFDCQGIGEFNVATNMNNDFLIQGRFVPYPSGKFVTVTSGIAIRDSLGLPVVQISLTENPSPTTQYVKGCPVDLYVDGVQRDLFSGSGSDEVQIDMDGNIAKVGFFRSGLSVDVKIGKHRYGCALAQFVCIPQTRNDYQTNVIGLLGNIDDDKRSDWMGADNTAVAVPKSRKERIYEPSYDYCTKNWCVRNPEESLFTYEPGLSHGTYHRCDAAFGEKVNIDEKVPTEIKEICDDDIQCLVEGVGGGVDMAQAFIQNKKQHEAAAASMSCKTTADCGANSNCVNEFCVCNASFSNCDGVAANGCEAPTQDDNFKCAAEKQCNYFNDFEKFLNDGEWHNFDGLAAVTSGEGFDTTFLGGLGRDVEAPELKLKLDSNLESVFVSFDFLELDSWDGDSARFGKDYLEVFLTGDDGTKTIQLFFKHSNDEGTQSGNVDELQYSMVSKVPPTNFYGVAGWKDQIHNMNMHFPAKYLQGGDTLALTFNVVVNEAIKNEAGGIDNISVSSCPIAT